jgi:hypothetical protein
VNYFQQQEAGFKRGRLLFPKMGQASFLCLATHDQLNFSPFILTIIRYNGLKRIVNTVDGCLPRHVLKRRPSGGAGLDLFRPLLQKGAGEAPASAQ